MFGRFSLPVVAGFEAVAAPALVRLAVGLAVATLVAVLVLRVHLVDDLDRATGADLAPAPTGGGVLLPAHGHVLVHPGHVAHAADEATHHLGGGGGDQRPR